MVDPIEQAGARRCLIYQRRGRMIIMSDNLVWTQESVDKLIVQYWTVNCLNSSFAIFQFYIPVLYSSVIFQSYIPVFYSSVIFQCYIPVLYPRVIFHCFILELYSIFYSSVIFQSFMLVVYSSVIFQWYIPVLYYSIILQCVIFQCQKSSRFVGLFQLQRKAVSFALRDLIHFGGNLADFF